MGRSPETPELVPAGNSQVEEMLLEILAQVGKINQRLETLEKERRDSKDVLGAVNNDVLRNQLMLRELMNSHMGRYGD